MLGSFIKVPGEHARIRKAVAFSSISARKGKENNPIIRGAPRAIEDDGSFYETSHFDEDDSKLFIPPGRLLSCLNICFSINGLP